MSFEDTIMSRDGMHACDTIRMQRRRRYNIRCHGKIAQGKRDEEVLQLPCSFELLQLVDGICVGQLQEVSLLGHGHVSGMEGMWCVEGGLCSEKRSECHQK